MLFVSSWVLPSVGLSLSFPLLQRTAAMVLAWMLGCYNGFQTWLVFKAGKKVIKHPSTKSVSVPPRQRNPLSHCPSVCSVCCHRCFAKIWLNTLLLCHSPAILEALKYFSENVTLWSIFSTQMDSRKEDYAAEVVCAVFMDSFKKHTTHSVNRVVSSLLFSAHLSF